MKKLMAVVFLVLFFSAFALSVQEITISAASAWDSLVEDSQDQPQITAECSTIQQCLANIAVKIVTQLTK